MSVEVPEAFQQIGYSGVFYIEVAIPPEHIEAMRAMVPILMRKTPGWLCAAVTDDDKAVLVRQDAHAILDVCLGIPEMRL